MDHHLRYFNVMYCPTRFFLTMNWSTRTLTILPQFDSNIIKRIEVEFNLPFLDYKIVKVNGEVIVESSFGILDWFSVIGLS